MRRRDHERIVSELHREITYLQRQNDELLNRLMYANGQTWTPPPPTEEPPAEEQAGFLWAPEQQLDAMLEEG
jgi:hypothetical protein